MAQLLIQSSKLSYRNIIDVTASTDTRIGLTQSQHTSSHETCTHIIDKSAVQQALNAFVFIQRNDKGLPRSRSMVPDPCKGENL